jgi:hypothetical protein
MAYMNQERKNQLAPGIKKVLADYGMKATIATDRFTIKINVKEGPLDLVGDFNKTVASERERKGQKWTDMDYVDVNPYWFKNQFSNIDNLQFVEKLLMAANDGNWDKSDSQIDYFNVGWYVDLNIGRYDKPYKRV